MLLWWILGIIVCWNQKWIVWKLIQWYGPTIVPSFVLALAWLHRSRYDFADVIGCWDMTDPMAEVSEQHVMSCFLRGGKTKEGQIYTQPRHLSLHFLMKIGLYISSRTVLWLSTDFANEIVDVISHAEDLVLIGDVGEQQVDKIVAEIKRLFDRRVRWPRVLVFQIWTLFIRWLTVAGSIYLTAYFYDYPLTWLITLIRSFVSPDHNRLEPLIFPSEFFCIPLTLTLESTQNAKRLSCDVLSYDIDVCMVVFIQVIEMILLLAISSNLIVVAYRTFRFAGPLRNMEIRLFLGLIKDNIPALFAKRIAKRFEVISNL